MAMKAAVQKVIEEHARAGLPLYVWSGDRVVARSAKDLRSHLHRRLSRRKNANIPLCDPSVVVRQGCAGARRLGKRVAQELKDSFRDDVVSFRRQMTGIGEGLAGSVVENIRQVEEEKAVAGCGRAHDSGDFRMELFVAVHRHGATHLAVVVGQAPLGIGERLVRQDQFRLEQEDGLDPVQIEDAVDLARFPQVKRDLVVAAGEVRLLLRRQIGELDRAGELPLFAGAMHAIRAHGSELEMVGQEAK